MSPDVLLIAGASLVGNALVVWGVIRHELATMRAETARAHARIDAMPYRLQRVK